MLAHCLTFSLPRCAAMWHVRAWLVPLLLALALAGCAAQWAYRDGKDLVAQGRVEEGLAKFQEATARDPRALEYKAAYLQTRDRAIASYLEQADRLAAAGNFSAAEKLYQRALAIDPGSERARAGLRAVDAHARHTELMNDATAAWESQNPEVARFKLRSILTENPNHAGALALERTMRDKTATPPVESILAAAFRKPITIEFKDVALKHVFEVISRTSGLNFLFDKGVKIDQKTSIFLKNSTIASAVHFTLLTNDLEQQVLDANTILIYPNTAEKQKDYQEMVVKTFYLSNAEAKTVANTLKTILKARDVVTDDKLNLVIVRDSPAAVRLAEKLVAVHDVAEPEVMLEVEILEIKRTRLQELGIEWPDRLVLTPLPSASGGTLTVRDLRSNLNGGTIGAGIAPLTINAKAQDSDANILANPRIRARNHEKAKILIGERVPNITTTATASGFVSESITYVDVGLKLDVEPTIYLDNEVAIKVSLEVSNIVSQLQSKGGSVAYQIGTRTASTVLRLKDGENQVLAGLINDEDRRNASKVPGLGEIPLVGRLFGSASDNNQKTEIVLSITPRLIRNVQRPEAALSEFSAGTDNNFRNRPDGALGAVMPAARPPQRAPDRASAAGPASDMGGSPGRTGGAAGTPPAAGGPLPLPAPPAVATQLSWQGPPDARVGSVFPLQLIMQTEQPVISVPIAVRFDNRVLQVIGVTEGDFLKQGGAQTSFNSRVEPSGHILMTGTRSSDGGATGPGVIASINFRALAPADNAQIQLVTVAPVGFGGSAVTVPSPAPYAVRLQP